MYLRVNEATEDHDVLTSWAAIHHDFDEPKTYDTAQVFNLVMFARWLHEEMTRIGV